MKIIGVRLGDDEVGITGMVLAVSLRMDKPGVRRTKYRVNWAAVSQIDLTVFDR